MDAEGANIILFLSNRFLKISVGPKFTYILHNLNLCLKTLQNNVVMKSVI